MTDDLNQRFNKAWDELPDDIFDDIKPANINKEKCPECGEMVTTDIALHSPDAGGLDYIECGHRIIWTKDKEIVYRNGKLVAERDKKHG